MKKHQYTVLQTVYIKDDVNYLEESIISILNQTIKPSEYLILADGKLTEEANKILKNYEKKHKEIKVVFYDENRGLGPVLADGIELSKFQLIARMDSDDIAMPTRCEKQLEVITKNDFDIVGCNIAEFIDSIDNVISFRSLPEKDLLNFSKKRNPFNHPSVMLKKDAVLRAGNYRKYHLCEDYDLWTRMLMSGSNGYNIQENLHLMRISEDFYKRRSGIKYLNAILKFKTELFKKKYINFFELIILYVKHTLICLCPNFIRKSIYKKMLRGRA